MATIFLIRNPTYFHGYMAMLASMTPPLMLSPPPQKKKPDPGNIQHCGAPDVIVVKFGLTWTGGAEKWKPPELQSSTDMSVILPTVVNVPPSVSTATPRVAIYEVPDVSPQPSKLKPDSFWRTSSVTTSQPNAEVGATPRTDPNQSKTTTGTLTPALTQKAVLSTSETNNRIKLITPSVSQTNQRDKYNPPRNSSKNTSKSPADRKESDLPKTSGIQQTGNGKPGPIVEPVGNT